MTKKRILILMAMKGEADPVIDLLQLESVPKSKYQIDAELPMNLFEGQHKNSSVLLCLNGVCSKTKMDLIGTNPAAISTLIGVQKFRPDMILNAGTCGALHKNDVRIGELFLAVDRIYSHTRRIPLPGWDQMGRGGYPTAGTPELAEKLGLIPGILSSTDSLDFPTIDAENFDLLNADIADMEAVAMAWIASLYEIPFYSIKGVTDLMDLPIKTGEQFQKHFKELVPRIAEKVEKMVFFLSK